MVLNRGLLAATAAALFISGCATTEPPKAPPIHINEDPYPSTYVRYPGALTVIRHATVFTGDGQQINDGTVVFGNGVIEAVGGPQVPSPAGAVEIDGTGKFVTPGIIDVHSHLGDYPSPASPAIPMAMKPPIPCIRTSGPSIASGRRTPAFRGR